MQDRYTGLTTIVNKIPFPLNPIKSSPSINIEFRLNSEWIRHYTQNMLHIVKPQQQFKMMSSNFLPVLNLYEYETSHYTLY